MTHKGITARDKIEDPYNNTRLFQGKITFLISLSSYILYSPPLYNIRRYLFLNDGSSTPLKLTQ